MPSIVLYLLKCSISLAIVWLFYQLLLRRLTFYSMNRWYLMGYAALSLILPLIHITIATEEQMADKIQVIRYIPVFRTQPSVGPATPERAYTGWDLLLVVLALGTLLLLVRLLIRYLSLRRIQKRALLIGDGHLTIYHVNEPITPFSFGKAIYLNPRLHSEKECEEIILHEYVHVRQRHTVDILVGEALCIFSWFNPFSWLIRHSIRQNLEFIADRQVLASGLDRKAYQYHLLKVVGESRYGLANNFNFSSLKKRIIMMNKSRSAKLHLVKFLFIVPLLAVLLVAFRDRADIHLPTLHKETPLPETGVESVQRPGGFDTNAEGSVTSPIKDTTPHVAKDTLSGGPVLILKQVQVKDTLKEKPMFVIDEVESSDDAMGKLNPKDIAFINVLKNDQGTARLGPRAQVGVVLIYTKAYAPGRKNEILLKDGTKVKLAVPVRDMPPPVKDDDPPGTGTLQRDTAHMEGVSMAEDQALKTARDVADTSAYKSFKDAVIMVDGKPSSYEELKKIDPSRIESISIWNSGTAGAPHGSQTKKVLITLKKQITLVLTDKDGSVTTRSDTIRAGN